ncbi:MAG: hypothetical protein ACLTS1_14880 [Coprococcus sp.]
MKITRKEASLYSKKYYEDYHMEYDVALKEAIRDSAKKFLDAEKAELIEEKGRNSKG